ncbi:type VI secretion system protein TssR [Mucilaginibacter koreensis]
MKNIIALITLLLPLAASAQSPVSFSKKVVTMPAAFEKPTAKTNVYDDEKSTSLPWIVFSDRDENYTYTAPGGTLVMKKIKFMEPYYVSEAKNGYLKLLKYQPGMVQGRKLTNKKSAQSYGWISRDKVLLWQSAFVNPQTGYPAKSLAIISGKGPLTMPHIYYDRTDSLNVYTSPELERGKGKVGLHNILYIFKKSADGRTVLVGSEGQLIADSAAKSVYGWVPADAVHTWGDRLYIGSARNNYYDSDDSVAAIVNQSFHYTGQGASGLGGFAFDPLLEPDQPLLRSIAVVSSSSPDYKTGTLQLGVAGDVYDKTHNQVINIKGGHINYANYLNIRRNIRKINVVYVIDGGSTMRNYFGGITSTVQSFEKSFLPYNATNRITYGAVVYRSNADCGKGGVSTQPFSADYRRVVRFLDKEAATTASCSAGVNSQPVYDGIGAATAMLAKHANETNIIVLIGSTGDNNDSQSAIEETAAQVAAANARILAVQVYSDYNSVYNNFVIQARKLVSQSAVLLADRKKQRMVEGEGLTNAQQFNVSVSDSVSFYLDYPKNSLVQGAVIFPPKGVIKSNREMEAALKRMLGETDMDIRSQTHSLDSAFRLTGRERRYVQPIVVSNLTAPVPDSLGDNMPHNAFKYYLTAEAPATLVTQHPNELQYLVILNEDEYKQASDILSLLIGENLQQDASNYRSKLYKNYIDLSRKRLKLNLSKSEIKKLTLDQYIQRVIGLPLPDNKELTTYKVNDLKSTSRMPQQAFEAYINYLVQHRNQIKQAALLNQHFTSNGKNYYYITQANWR